MRQRFRQRHRQRYERQVGSKQVNGFRQDERIANIHLLHANHPRVLPQAVVQLAVSDIYGIDPRRAPL